MHRQRSILRPNQKPENNSVLGLETMLQSPRPPAVKTKMVEDPLSLYLDCECGPDFYNRILGPTADEALLKGIRTVFSVCNKFMACDKQPEVQFEPGKSKSVPKVVSDILESIELPPEIAEKIVQTSFSQLEQEKPELASKILQTSMPELLSKMLSAFDLQPDLISQIIQTVSLQSMRPSLYSGAMQTSYTTMISAEVQTSVTEISEPSESTKHSTKESSLATIKKESMGDTKTLSKNSSLGSKIEEESIKTINEKDEKRNCVCCKCYRKLLQERAENSECLKNKSEPPPKLKICRCYDCSAPVVYRIHKQQDCLCKKSRLQDTHRIYSQHHNLDTGSYLSLEKGDICSHMGGHSYCEHNC